MGVDDNPMDPEELKQATGLVLDLVRIWAFGLSRCVWDLGLKDLLKNFRREYWNVIRAQSPTPWSPFNPARKNPDVRLVMLKATAG